MIVSKQREKVSQKEGGGLRTRRQGRDEAKEDFNPYMCVVTKDLMINRHTGA